MFICVSVGNGFEIENTEEISVAKQFGILMDIDFQNTKRQESKG